MAVGTADHIAIADLVHEVPQLVSTTTRGLLSQALAEGSHLDCVVLAKCSPRGLGDLGEITLGIEINSDEVLRTAELCELTPSSEHQSEVLRLVRLRHGSPLSRCCRSNAR